MDKIEVWVNAYSGIAVSWMIKILAALVIFYLGKKVAKFVANKFVKALEKKSKDKAVSGFLSSIIYALLMIAVVLMALGQLGIETTSFVAILGAAGLAVGLALKDSLANFASGVMIILFRPIKSGEYVEAGGVAGVVETIEIFATTLKTPDNKVVIVPNSAITGGSITNYSRMDTRRIDLVIGVSYDADLRQSKKLLKDILAKDSRVLADPESTVAVSELADSSVNFVVRPWVKTEDYWTVYFDLLEEIKVTLDEHGVGIPYPQMDVHLHQSNG